jgi:hypothetical protein
LLGLALENRIQGREMTGIVGELSGRSGQFQWNIMKYTEVGKEKVRYFRLWITDPTGPAIGDEVNHGMNVVRSYHRDA